MCDRSDVANALGCVQTSLYAPPTYVLGMEVLVTLSIWAMMRTSLPWIQPKLSLILLYLIKK